MKKALSLVLALVLALSLGVTAFAVVDSTVEIPVDGEYTESSDSGKTEILGSVTDATYGWTANKYKIDLSAITVDGEGIFWADTPRYDYPAECPNDIWFGNFKITYVGGKEFGSAAIASDGKTLVITATSKALVETGVLKFSVQGIGSYTNADKKTAVAKSEVVNFEITFTPDYVGGSKTATVDASLAIQLYLDEFVLSADQFAMLAKQNITVKALDNEFKLTTKVVKGQGAFNFKYNTVVDEDVADANEDANIRAVNFIGTQTFKGDAKITFSNAVGAWLSLGDVINHTGDETVYVYTFDGEKLTLVDKQDAAKGDIVYTASAGKALGSIYLSDKELKGAKADESSSSSSSGNKGNVDTGANDMVSVAVAMAVVSLAAAGAVAFKKASK